MWEFNERVDLTTPGQIGWRFLRGGGWNSFDTHARAEYTISYVPDYSGFSWYGIRVAKTLGETGGGFAVPSLSPLGTAMLCGLLGLAALRRLRS